MDLEKYYILSIAKVQIQKELEKLENKIKRLSVNLGETDLNQTSMRNRAMQRARLSSVCELRDRFENKLSLVNKWLSEV